MNTCSESPSSLAAVARLHNFGGGDSVCIGKFDILATYVFARGLVDGLKDDEAKQRGLVAAIMGAQAKLGIRKEHHEEFQAQKESAERKNKTTITAGSFDKQVAHKMGGFFRDVFLPTLKKLVEAAEPNEFCMVLDPEPVRNHAGNRGTG